MNTNVVHDYYSDLSIPRDLSLQDVKRLINKKIKQNADRISSSAGETEKLKELEAINKLLHNARKIFSSEKNRKEYDDQLENQKAKGQIASPEQARSKDLLSKAEFFLHNFNYDDATRFAFESIRQDNDNLEAYDFLGKLYYEKEEYEQAVNIIDKALRISPDNIRMLWCSARYNIFNQNSSEAQAKINRMLEIDPNSYLAKSEQVYLYLMYDHEIFALEQIDKYLAAYPNDINFRKQAAENLFTYARTFFVWIEELNEYGIIGAEDCEVAMVYLKKAYELYPCERYQELIETTEKYNTKIFDDTVLGDIGVALVFSLVLFFINHLAGVIAVIPIILLVPVSFVPFSYLLEIQYTDNGRNLLQGFLYMIVKIEGFIVAFIIGMILETIKIIRELLT